MPANWRMRRARTIDGQVAEIRHLNEAMHAIQEASQQITQINNKIFSI